MEYPGNTILLLPVIACQPNMMELGSTALEIPVAPVHPAPFNLIDPLGELGIHQLQAHSPNACQPMAVKQQESPQQQPSWQSWPSLRFLFQGDESFGKIRTPEKHVSFIS